MRIVIDLQGAQSNGSRNRGIGRYSLSLAQAIIRNKGDNEVLIALNGLFPETIEPIRKTFDNLIPQENIHVWNALGPVSHLETENRWRRNAAEITRESFLESLNPDVIYITSLIEGLTDDAVSSIGRLSQITPTAVTLYDLIPLINRSPYLDNPPVELWYEGKLDHMRRASCLLAISESSSQEAINYLGFPPDRSLNIGTAADPQFKKIDISESTRKNIRRKYELSRDFLMYTGGIDHRKNIEALIRAYSMLPNAIRTKHQLAIVCSIHADTRRLLSDLASSLGMKSDELKLTGFVPEEDLIALYHMCKAFIFPSWHEGFGLPALEAMCCGAPVIAANTSSLPEVIGENEALFDPFDEKSIKNKIEQVLTDEKFRTKLIKHSERQSQKFSWDECGRRAIKAFEELYTDNISNKSSITKKQFRPTLAYISPLPPQRTGIADYSAELLPELSRYYKIDVIVDQAEVSHPWINENCVLRSTEWFKENSQNYDRVLYHFGNSAYHQHMFGLLEDAPGVTVLHDFYLGHITVHMDSMPDQPNKGYLANSLYQSHGYHALQDLTQTDNIWDIAWKYPCSKYIFDKSISVITHSTHAVDLANNWYGKNAADQCDIVPLLRYSALITEKAKSKKKLKLDENSFVVCSFGLLGETKLNLRVLNAWLKSELSQDDNCYLIFVGENDSGEYGANLIESINKSGKNGHIKITGWTDLDLFRQYLSATDIAVQLRSQSRGETSAAVLDCMNYGVATVVNAHGSMADLPKDSVYMISDQFSDIELASALEKLWRNENTREALSSKARQHILTKHSPRICADQYAYHIEKKYAKYKCDISSVIKEVSNFDFTSPDNHTLISFSDLLSRNQHKNNTKQLLIDISILVQCDAKSGIQRVVRSILLELLQNPPEGYRVEPIYSAGPNSFRYARTFVSNFLKYPNPGLQDDPIFFSNQDIYLCLDLTLHIAVSQIHFYHYMRQFGAKVYFVAYDLLPLYFPDFFPEGAHLVHSEWLQLLAQMDGVVCISKSVADELVDWLDSSGIHRSRPLQIGWFHLGADVNNSAPTSGLPDNASYVLQNLSSRPTFLSVGTIEPRKGQLQTLKAAEELWSNGSDINLVFVGKKGWNMDEFVEIIQQHPEYQSRLFWLEAISDEYLEKIYSISSCLIAASAGEGFGLPLIEAAQNKIPVIARDIPVFREVAGSFATYFSGYKPTDLAAVMSNWLTNTNISPLLSTSIPWLSWKNSTDDLVSIIISNNWYKYWTPDINHYYWGSSNKFGTQVGIRSGKVIVTTGKSGYLLFGPYIHLESGKYKISVNFLTSKFTYQRAKIDVVGNKGSDIFIEPFIFEFKTPGKATELILDLDQSCTDLEVRIWVDQDSDFSVSDIRIIHLTDKDEHTNSKTPQKLDMINQ